MSDNQAPLVAIIHTASEVGDRVRAYPSAIDTTLRM